MKKNPFGMFVAALAMLSACQPKPEEYAAIPVESGTVQFTASLGADTKTHMEYDADSQVYKNLWDQTDRFGVMSFVDNEFVSYATAYLFEGAGTTRATFASEAKQGDRYVAFYGYGIFNDDYSVSAQIPTRQALITADDVVRESYPQYFYPMYAESNDTNLEFKNLASVLKIEVSGNSYLESINIASNSEDVFMSGYMSVVRGDDGTLRTQMIADSTALNYISYDVKKQLSETEVLNCYVVIPAQTYTGGLTLTFTGSAGTMVKTYSQDLTFERSQIRAIRNVVFSEENPVSWGLVGTITNWENDIVMQKDGDCYSVSGVYLTAEDEFKFRANGLWDLNLGGGSLDAVLPNSTVSLWQDGANLKVAEEGYYSFKLYPYEGYVEVIQDLRVVSCANYDEVAAVEDGTYVRVQGYVFGMYGRGFMLNIGNYYRNTILVYTQTKPIDYTPVLGNALDIVALKVTYSGLPELKEVYAYEVLSAEEKDYGYGTGYDLRDPAFFDTVQIDRYDHVRFVGTLQQNGNYWNVVVDGATRIGSISYPLQDLTPYVGQKVMVLGWFCGLSTSGGNTYMNVMLRKILTPSEDGGTEDIIPGDDIVELPEIPQQ